MKKLLSLLVTILLIVSMAGTVSAAETTTTENIVYFEDGSHLITTIVQSASRSSQTTSGSARKTFVDANGNTCWQAILTGTFTYDGTTATCTKSTIEVNIYDSTYYTVSKTATKTGTTATGEFTIGQTFLGITIAKNTYNLALTCDKNGTLS